jgi:hypothetical protein
VDGNRQLDWQAIHDPGRSIETQKLKREDPKEAADQMQLRVV